MFRLIYPQHLTTVYVNTFWGKYQKIEPTYPKFDLILQQILRAGENIFLELFLDVKKNN